MRVEEIMSSLSPEDRATLDAQDKNPPPVGIEGATLADIREKKAPGKWKTFRAQSSLGGILLNQKRWAEAEPLLVSGFDGMKLHQNEIPAEQRNVLIKGAERLVRLCACPVLSIRPKTIVPAK